MMEGELRAGFGRGRKGLKMEEKSGDDVAWQRRNVDFGQKTARTIRFIFTLSTPHARAFHIVSFVCWVTVSLGHDM
jgi:hypothetical protein